MTDTDTWFRFGFCSMLNIQHRPNRKTNTVLLFRGMFWCVDDVLRLFKLFSFTLVHLADLIFRFFTLWAFVDPATFQWWAAHCCEVRMCLLACKQCLSYVQIFPLMVFRLPEFHFRIFTFGAIVGSTSFNSWAGHSAIWRCFLVCRQRVFSVQIVPIDTCLSFGI